MYVWVTGAQGLLGSALREKAQLATSREEADVGDFASLWKVAQEHPQITHIINAAAFSQVDLAEKLQDEAFKVNVVGPKHLAEVAKRIGARLIHISTDYVFGGEKADPFSEEDKASPCNYYGETKRRGEEEVLELLSDATVIRTSWIFGKGGKSFVTRLAKELVEKEELYLTCDQWGRATYVQDLVQAIFQLLDSSGLYHFAGQGITTRYQFALAMKEVMESEGIEIRTKKIIAVPGDTFQGGAKRPAYSALDTSKFEREVGPIRHWKEGLREFLHQTRL